MSEGYALRGHLKVSSLYSSIELCLNIKIEAGQDAGVDGVKPANELKIRPSAEVAALGSLQVLTP